uniref:Uncharacterized protein n=1 Tax=Peronospora matthiolae TaxID=2874970 RepID=A0AAV1TH08_9STRA
MTLTKLSLRDDRSRDDVAVKVLPWPLDKCKLAQ